MRPPSLLRLLRAVSTVSLMSLGLVSWSADSAVTNAVPVSAAFIDGTGPGWRTLGEADFTPVNCPPETWQWKGDEVLCVGQPIGVLRTVNTFTNLEFVVEWRHLKPAGNAGIFAWTPIEALTGLATGALPPGGIEVQMLDHDYTRQYAESTGRKPDWFTTHGDIFPVGRSKLKPFPPLSPSGERSFPRKQLSRGVGEWNHYYVRAINGEIRLWVNGEEVSGGNGAQPAHGHLCLESEGSPIELRRFRVRELP